MKESVLDRFRHFYFYLLAVFKKPLFIFRNTVKKMLLKLEKATGAYITM